MSNMKLDDRLGPKWKEDELRTFYRLYRNHGKHWLKISNGLVGRTVDMVESLFKKNKSYLSLPEGSATAVGLIAMMNDFYETQGGSEENSDEEISDDSERENYFKGDHQSKQNRVASLQKSKPSIKNQKSEKEPVKSDAFDSRKAPIKGSGRANISSLKIQETSRKDARLKTPEKLRHAKKSPSVELDEVDARKRKNGKNDSIESWKPGGNPWRSKRPRSSSGKKSKSKIRALPSPSISEENGPDREDNNNRKMRKGMDKQESENASDEEFMEKHKEEYSTPLKKSKHVTRARSGKKNQFKSNSNQIYSKNSFSSENDITSSSHSTENPVPYPNENNETDKLFFLKRKEKETGSILGQTSLQRKEKIEDRKSKQWDSNKGRIAYDTRKGKGLEEENELGLTKKNSSDNLVTNEALEHYGIDEKSSGLDALATLADLSLNGLFLFSESLDHSPTLKEKPYPAQLNVNQTPLSIKKLDSIQNDEKSHTVSTSKKSSSINIEDTDEEVEVCFKFNSNSAQTVVDRNGKDSHDKIEPQLRIRKENERESKEKSGVVKTKEVEPTKYEEVKGKEGKKKEEEMTDMQESLKDQGTEVKENKKTIVEVKKTEGVVKEMDELKEMEEMKKMERSDGPVDIRIDVPVINKAVTVVNDSPFDENPFQSKENVQMLSDSHSESSLERFDNNGKNSIETLHVKYNHEEAKVDDKEKRVKFSQEQDTTEPLKSEGDNETNIHYDDQVKDKFISTSDVHKRKRKRTFSMEEDSINRVNSCISSPKSTSRQKRQYHKHKSASCSSFKILSPVSNIGEKIDSKNFMSTNDETNTFESISRKPKKKQNCESLDQDRDRISNPSSDETIIELNEHSSKHSVCYHSPPGIPSHNSIRAKLSHCLSQSVQKWCMYEWFYGTVDIPWFMRNEFMEYLRHASLSHVCRLTRAEWGVIRSSLGKPRRLSPRFLEEERQKLAGFREAARQHYQHLRSGLVNSLPPDLSFPLMVGERVLALHPKRFIISEGSVLTVDRGRCRIQFDNPKLGVELLQDMDIMRLSQRTHNEIYTNSNGIRNDKVTHKISQNPLTFHNSIPYKTISISGNIPYVSSIQSGSIMSNAPNNTNIANSYTMCLQTSSSPSLSTVDVNHLTKRAQMLSGIAETVETVAMAKAATNEAVLAYKAAANDRILLESLGAEKEQDVNILLNLGRFLDQKQALLMELRNMNDEAETKVESRTINGEKVVMKNSEIFQRQYAMIIVQLRAVNQQVEAYLQLLRQRSKIKSENSNPPLKGVNLINDNNNINGSNSTIKYNNSDNDNFSKINFNVNVEGKKNNGFPPITIYSDEKGKSKSIYLSSSTVNVSAYPDDKYAALSIQKPSPGYHSGNVKTLSPQFHRQISSSSSAPSFPSVSDIAVSAERQCQAIFSKVLNTIESEKKKEDKFSNPPSSPLSNLLSSNSPPLSTVSSPTSTPYSSPTVSSTPSTPSLPPAPLSAALTSPQPSSIISPKTTSTSLDIQNPVANSSSSPSTSAIHFSDSSRMVGVHLSAKSNEVKIGNPNLSQSQVQSQNQIHKSLHIDESTDDGFGNIKSKIISRDQDDRISKLMSSCVSTLLMIKECADRNMPLADVSLTLEKALSTLHPLHSANSRIFKEISDSLTVIKSLISTEIPSHAC